MQSQLHRKHIASRVSHADCPECRADTERRFVSLTPWRYQYVSDYLRWARPRLQALRDGADTPDARRWQRRFLEALHTRISQKTPASGRKRCDSYLERLANARSVPACAHYLRRFASRGASCLDR